MRPAAVRALRKLDPGNRPRIHGAIALLAEDPRPPASRPLRGRPGFWVRVGDYRVISTIADAVLLVVVVALGHRREVFRYGAQRGRAPGRHRGARRRAGPPSTRRLPSPPGASRCGCSRRGPWSRRPWSSGAEGGVAASSGRSPRSACPHWSCLTAASHVLSPPPRRCPAGAAERAERVWPGRPVTGVLARASGARGQSSTRSPRRTRDAVCSACGGARSERPGTDAWARSTRLVQRARGRPRQDPEPVTFLLPAARNGEQVSHGDRLRS
ncbi:MAG: type II toxin-antitoxin system RelE family toxin [Acidimicrobiales bacterium]